MLSQSLLLRWWDRISLALGQQRGQGLVEYALIIALIALALVAGVTTLGSTLNQFVFVSIVSQLP